MHGKWHYLKGGKSFGPFGWEQFRQLAAAGLLAKSDLVCCEGMRDWVQAGRIGGLYGESMPLPLATPVGRGESPPLPLAMPVGYAVSATEAKPAPGNEPIAKSRLLLWNPNAASNWSLLFSPAFGPWLHAANWRALGRPDKARTNMVWVWITLIFMAVCLVLPFLSGSTGENTWVRGIAGLLLLVWYFTQGRPQANYVHEHARNGYARRGWTLPLLAGMAAVGGFLALFFGLAFATRSPGTGELATTVEALILRKWHNTPELRNATIQNVVLVHKGGKTYTGFVDATTGGRATRLTLEVVVDRGAILWEVRGSSSAPHYGTLLEFNGGELYYTPEVTREEPQKLGQLLVEEKFFDGGRKTVQLNKSGDTYEVRIVVEKGSEQDPQVLEEAKRWASDISKKVLGSARVDVHLCDESLQTVRVVVPTR